MSYHNDDTLNFPQTGVFQITPSARHVDFSRDLKGCVAGGANVGRDFYRPLAADSDDTQTVQ